MKTNGVVIAKIAGKIRAKETFSETSGEKQEDV